MPELPPITQRIKKLFTDEQVSMLLDEFEQMARHGYGNVLIVFDNHHPQRIERTISIMFPKPAVRYKAE